MNSTKIYSVVKRTDQFEEFLYKLNPIRGINNIIMQYYHPVEDLQKKNLKILNKEMDWTCNNSYHIAGIFDTEDDWEERPFDSIFLSPTNAKEATKRHCPNCKWGFMIDNDECMDCNYGWPEYESDSDSDSD